MAEQIESVAQFKSTPTGQAKRWDVEMRAAYDDQKDWQARGDKIVNRFIDNRLNAEVRSNDGDTRVNLFTANVQTLRALLYGNTPKVDVKRRFTDPNDDEARTAGEILQRLLNTDIERDSDTYAEALEMALDDRLLSGLGVARLRYVTEIGKKDFPAIPDKTDPATGRVRKGAPAYSKEIKTYENVDVDYVHWRDFRWSPSRTWDDVRWVAFRNLMTKDAMEARFGKKIAKLVPYNAKGDKVKRNTNDEGEKYQPWARCEVWEIWNKEDKNVLWWVQGYPEVLETKADTLELDGFFPMARPMFANLTTTKLIPTPDFTLAQDLYDEVDMVSTRITLLERAVQVRGVYDKTTPEINRLLTETVGNQLIPTDNFAIFKEKGGLEGVVDWMPLEQIVGALEVLKTYRVELMGLLFQVTGMSDIMRGQANDKNVTATEQAIKAKFASTRVQAFQNEFARFASDLQAIKAEIISKHFEPETILARSNVRYMTGTDPQLALKAIEIIKSDIYQYRIEVKPESVAITDMAAVKQERSEFLMAMATFLQSSQPIVAAAPWAGPYLIQMLQWSMAGYRGGATIESVLDQMVQAAQQAAVQAANTPPPPDPKVQQIQLQMQMDQQQNQMEIELKKLELQFKMIEKKLELDTTQKKNEIEIQGKAADLDMKQQQNDMKLQQGQQQMALDQQKGQMEQVQSIADHQMQMEQSRAEHKASMEQSQQQHKVTMQQAKEKAAAKPKPAKKGGK